MNPRAALQGLDPADRSTSSNPLDVGSEERQLRLKVLSLCRLAITTNDGEIIVAHEKTIT